MEENISERSGFVRFALGTGLTALGVSHLAKDNGNRGIGALLVAAGAMKMAEGTFRYCPTKALISSNMKDAVASGFSEYLDTDSLNGDKIIQAYNDFYSSRWSENDTSSNTKSKSKHAGKNANSQSNGGSSKSASKSKINDTATAASDIAKIVRDATSDNSMATLASQATKAASAVLNNQNQQKQNNSSYSH